ncbi:FkbM family methyltransferase [Ancylobacter sp. TS-1]|uniref:FkbM family methyltransferase n=1 Tax=Ancylobacter sp. TS-1 TaxID=1850374 RepID=UPI001390B3F9|nr:FkbM family methyltransferase [Ancylobacter sp. TS-1]
MALSSVKKLVPAPVRDLIARCRAERRGHSGETLRHTYLGESLSVVVADGMSRGWYGADWPEGSRTEIDLLATLGLPRDGLIFDIGAHQGVVAILLKRKLAPQGRVVCVELNGTNAAACTENFRLNGEDNMVCLHAAISDRPGFVRVTGRSNGQIVAEPSMLNFLYPKVECLTVDDMIGRFGTPSLVFLDVEGAEVLAMKGAERALSSVNAWFIELHGDETCGQFGGSNRGIARVFAAAGFTLHTAVDEGPFFPLADPDAVTGERGYLVATRA